MKTFWIFWTFNALMALIPVYFFLIGLMDGSVSSRNIGIWMILLLVVALIIGGTLWLKSINQLLAAKWILIIASVPGIFAILYFLIVLTSNARWN